ncbi:DUF262 domain-containing protein [Mangrovimicrobium sediminis]|uniref:DUF262 domain-containing protein n=1 Tax=Mangrovimicrobium sediminis TaxID=2562682 RepID=A0A4Z0LY44_9GAMM|nr:DUF262 domain-containing protein [Haliea sp. SAOS-164]TGD72170.1 DUF262 domain-containing protein [Haliea sp. SAOS-164]
MSYNVTTIAETLGRINQGVYIPGIQRPYVWTADQIIRLFDSLMRKYPIGTLLLWNLPAQSRDDWEVYRFVENFWEGDIHNDRVEISGDQPCTLVLDGQQRLTSLLIGLKGTYTLRKKGKRRSNADAWEELALHIDLAHAPEADDALDDEDSPLSEHYRFKFFDVSDRPRQKPGELWFEVSFILGVATEEEYARLETSWITNNSSLEASQKSVAKENLRRLWDMVWQDETLASFTEKSASYDRVLDIFIRANDGGTRLSRSDLLMSVITLRWEQFNARTETEELLEALTKELLPKRAFQREFLLRTALYLNNLDFSIQVKNFTPANIRKLEQSWDSVKQAMTFTARWMRANGLYGDALSGHNLVMFLSYYFWFKGISDETTPLSNENSETIRQWVILMQFQKLLSLQTKKNLTDYRTVIRKMPSHSVDFPVADVSRMFALNGRVFGFNAEWSEKLCDVEMDQNNAEKLLSIVYGKDLAANQLRPLPLIQSRYFMPEELKRAGIPEALHTSVQHHANRLGLALALTEDESVHYYELPFDQWIQRLTPNQLEQHFLPDDIQNYRLGNLPELITRRREIIASRLGETIPEVRESA